MVERIDRERLPAARAVLDYVIPRVREDGRFHPEDSLFAESSGYQAQLAGTLAVVGKLLDDERCGPAARQIFCRMLENRVQGLWSLDWWWDHPIVLPAPPDWRLQNRTPDPRYTPLTLYNLGLYHRVSGDDAVVAPARDAMARMFDRWDYSEGSWLAMTPEFAALAVWAWEDALPEFSPRKDSTVKWVADTFVKAATTDFPFASAVRMTLLLATTGTKYLESVFKPGIEALLAEPSRRFDHNPNDFPGITHIKLPGSKQRTILDESHRSISHGCRQPSNQAHKTISRRGELAAPGSGGGFHHVCTPFKLLRARTSPLVASLHL